MVYEARAGQTFLLGASTWRIEEITRDRVLVSPAPGRAGRGAVLEGRGRRAARTSSARRSARASRELVGARRRAGARRGCAGEYLLDERAARNLLTFLREQEAATGAVPSDRTIVVERFRDEIGDWRVCILTPFGGRVHAPWALALTRAAARVARPRGAVDLVGRRHRAPPPRRRRAAARRRPAARAGRGRGSRRRGARRDRALRRALPRERRARAADPAPPAGPAHAALAAAAEGAVAAAGRAPLPARSRSCSRPTASACRTSSTCRRCAACCTGIQRGSSTWSRSRPRQRLAVLGLAALRLRRDVHVRGRHAAGRAPRAGALARPRPAARAARAGGAARPARRATRVEEVERQLRGDAADSPTSCTTCCACAATCARASTTRSSRRRCSTSAARSWCGRGRGAADRGRGRRPLPRRARRDAAGGVCRTPSSRAARTRCAQLVLRFARAAGRSRPPRRASASAATSRRCCAELEREELLVRGELRPGGTEREWCDPDVLRRLRRASLAALRREVEPVEQAALARFLPSWHGIDRRAIAARGARSAAGACRCRWRSGSRRSCRGACPDYRPEQLDPLCASGEVVWVGAGLDRVAVYFREDAPVLGAAAGCAAPRGRGARPDPRRAGRGAPRSGSTCSTRPGSTDEEALPALWDLVWAGEVTNDAWKPLRAGRRYGVPKPERRPRRFSRRARRAPSRPRRAAGRATERLFAGAEPRAPRALAELLLERQGIVTRDGVRAEGIPRRLRRRLRRSCARSRRSASAAAATSSRASAEPSSRSAARSSACASCATRDEDAAGRRSCSPRPIRRSRTAPRCRGRSAPGARAARVAGAYVVLLGGEAALFVERGGRTLAPAPRARRALAAAGACGARRPRPPRG